MFKLLFLFIFIVGCSHAEVNHKKPDKDYSDELVVLKEKQAKMIEEYGNEWKGRDCDGMIWNGRVGAINPDFDVLAAENKDEPGRFHRRSEPYCWNETDGDVGSKTTWSRDMAICGLFPYLWRQKQLDVAMRHADYGKENLWKMGKPLADGRVFYTPAMVGNLYEIIYALGGPDSVGRHWENVYPKGLDDYHAHLQVCNIWLRGEIGEHHRKKKSPPKEYEFGEISEKMHDRINEHYKREPNDHFYAYMYSLYSGDYSPAVKVCMDDNNKPGGYVRCKGDDCVLAHKIFACGMLIERLEDAN